MEKRDGEDIERGRDDEKQKEERKCESRSLLREDRESRVLFMSEYVLQCPILLVNGPMSMSTSCYWPPPHTPAVHLLTVCGLLE